MLKNINIIATYLVRNDSDILKDSIVHNLNNGVDALIVTEHNSSEESSKILDQFNDYILERIIEYDDVYNQSKWVTHMARIAASYKPDWIIHCDADELWHNLKCLDEIDHNLCLTKCWVNHLPYSIDNFSISEAIEYEIPLDQSIFGIGMQNKKKIIHKPDISIKILQGNHGVESDEELFQTDVVIHHYPVRTYEQFKNKSLIGGKVYEKYQNEYHGKHWRRWYNDYINNKLMETYMSFLK